MAESPAALTSEGVDISVDIEEGGKPAPTNSETLNTSSITSATANPQILQPSTSAAETSVADSHAILADMATSNINSTAQDTQNLDTAFTGDDDDELSDGDIIGEIDISILENRKNKGKFDMITFFYSSLFLWTVLG